MIRGCYIGIADNSKILADFKNKAFSVEFKTFLTGP
jgi:hypothetical protein